MEYRYGSHTVFQIEYHLVWVTKYRYKVLRGEVAERIRELVPRAVSNRPIKGTRRYKAGFKLFSQTDSLTGGRPNLILAIPRPAGASRVNDRYEMSP